MRPCRDLMQTILDRYKVGIEVVGVNLQARWCAPTEQVQASFDDVLKAAQERERAKNEAQAYANDVVPRAGGAASRYVQKRKPTKLESLRRRKVMRAVLSQSTTSTARRPT